jgi:malonate decarboxylase gamma subunit
MTLDEILKGLFPMGHTVKVKDDLVLGSGTLPDGSQIAVVGVANGAPLGPDGVIILANEVLRVVAGGGSTPILVLVDTEGQLMARSAETLGLNEYLSHLAKCLLLASQMGHRTIGLEYGKAAAGAFLATAFATETLVALPGATPAVMDLPSMAKVTKLSLSQLEEMAKKTPVFAPGLDHMVQIGAVRSVWDDKKPLDTQLMQTLQETQSKDTRDVLGAERKGRLMAAGVASRVAQALAANKGTYVVTG